MGKLRDRLRGLSDKIYKRIDDGESRAALTNLLGNIMKGETPVAKEQLMTKAIEVAAKVVPKFDINKTKEKGVEGMTEGTIAGVLASVAALALADKIGIDDAQTKTLMTVAFTALVTGLTVAIKRIYFNWQKHRNNK